MPVKQQIVEKLTTQSLKEIEFAYQYKQARLSSWNRNEDMYYGRKILTDDARANVGLGKMQGFVHTLLSKIDNPLSFEFSKGEIADMKKAKLFNALKERDAKTGHWDFKDILSKKSGLIYGRTVFLYYAESPEGKYKSNLSQIDPKDFLIDPDAGGADVERGLYLGWWNTKLSKAQLTAGAKSGLYIKSAVTELLTGGGNSTEKTKQDIDKENRFASFAAKRPRLMQREDQFRFFTWITTDEKGDRYYLILTTSGQCVRCEKWTDIQTSGKYPVWTWATFPDEFEFWTPSYCDYVREIFLAQEKSINQMLDNAEQINRPQTAVNVDYITNLAQVKYKKDGYIEINGNVDVNRVIQTRVTPSINTPMIVYDKLEAIGQSESGVTAGSKGVSEEDKVAIYEGNLQQAGDRFGLLNKSYSEGYSRFADLYKEGVMQHLDKKEAVRIIGSMGLEIEYITKRDLKPGRLDFDIIVKSGAAEAQSNLVDQKNKITFLSGYKDSQVVNQQVLFEIGAEIAGIDDDTIKRLKDTQNNSSAEMVAEAEESFQKIIGGNKVPLYKYADSSFMQRLIDLSDRYDHELSAEQHQAVFAYIEGIKEIVMKNMMRRLADQLSKEGKMAGAEGGGSMVDASKLEDPNAVNGELPVNPKDQAAQDLALSNN